VRAIICIFLFAAAASAQFQNQNPFSDPQLPSKAGTPANCFQPGGYPNNCFPNVGYISPAGALQKVKYCAWDTDEQGQHAAVGVTVKIGGWWTEASGWHEHEANLFFRPKFQLSGDTTVNKTTVDNGDNTGCASWSVIVPALAGWVTMFGTPLGVYPVRGGNWYAGIGLSPFVTIQHASGVSADTLTAIGTDNYHSGQGFSVAGSIYGPLYAAFVAFTEETSAYDSNGVLVISGPRPTLIRASVPNGGLLDDLTYGGPFWWTATNEEHMVGLEVDVKNPNAGGALAYFDILVKTMAQARCRLGLLQQGVDAPIPNTMTQSQYWAARQSVHFACGSVFTGGPRQ
jgi:hypothetical protein